MSGTSPSDRGPMNAGWLTFATQLADSFGPGTTAPKPGILRRLVAWGMRPVGGGRHGAMDATTRLEITALGGVRR